MAGLGRMVRPMHTGRVRSSAGAVQGTAVQTSTMGEAERMAREHLRIVAAGDESAVPANVTADYLNHRSADEPLAARQPGPDGLKATMRWLQRAFTDMRFEVHEFALHGNLVALHVTFRARQHGPFVVHDSPDTRCHRDGGLSGHWTLVRRQTDALDHDPGRRRRRARRGSRRSRHGTTTGLDSAKAHLHRADAPGEAEGTPRAGESPPRWQDVSGSRARDSG